LTDPGESTASLRTYAQVLRRRKWLIIETVVFVTATVVLVSMLQPTLYSATARVLAQSQSPSVSVAVGASIDLAKPDERELQTLASLAVTPEIVSAAKQDLAWRDQVGTLRADLSAEADPNTDIISITAERPDPEEAAALANATAAAFVAWRQQALQRSLDEAIGLLNEQIDAPATGTAARNALIERRTQLEVLKPLASDGLVIGEAAQTPTSPSSPKPLRNGVLAFAAGLVLGIGLAFVRESFDTKLHSAEDIAELSRVPVIATVPEFRRHERAPAKIVVLNDLRSTTAEAYRFLRTNLEFVNFGNDLRIILVTSPQPSQGKSTTIANLAVSLALADRRVAVVEGDLRRPSLHSFFKVTNARGVTDVVSGRSSLADALQTLHFTAEAPPATAKLGQTGMERDAPRGMLELSLLPSGPLPPNPGEIVGSPQFAAVLKELANDADYVLVDAPPMFTVGDAAAMAPHVDGMVVVLRLGETTADTVRSVEGFFAQTPTRALGIVVTGTPQHGRGRYSRYGDYAS
jgi:Mrp family chromosome partitioning ATPase/capsular polysaccharide biosynthesis protein